MKQLKVSVLVDKSVEACPFCGEAVNIRVSPELLFVECGNCHAAGPDGTDAAEAVDLWNKAQQSKAKAVQDVRVTKVAADEPLAQPVGAADGTGKT